MTRAAKGGSLPTPPPAVTPPTAAELANATDLTGVIGLPGELPAVQTIPAHRTLAEVPAKIARAAEIAQVIRADMAADVERFDGMPVDGRTVAEIHANLAAAIVDLANCVEALAQVLA